MATKTFSSYLKCWHLCIHMYTGNNYTESSGHWGLMWFTCEPARDSDETRLGALGLEKHPPKNLREVGWRGKGHFRGLAQPHCSDLHFELLSHLHRGGPIFRLYPHWIQTPSLTSRCSKHIQESLDQVLINIFISEGKKRHFGSTMVHSATHSSF